jgi:hypothetical protein
VHRHLEKERVSGELVDEDRVDLIADLFPL